jgi:hypothetical protein
MKERKEARKKSYEGKKMIPDDNLNLLEEIRALE